MKYYIHKYIEAVYTSYKTYHLYSTNNDILAGIDYDFALKDCYVMFYINRTFEFFVSFKQADEHIINMLAKFDYKELPKELEILL
jgi:hypothetical protein